MNHASFNNNNNDGFPTMNELSHSFEESMMMRRSSLGGVGGGGGGGDHGNNMMMNHNNHNNNSMSDMREDLGNSFRRGGPPTTPGGGGGGGGPGLPMIRGVEQSPRLRSFPIGSTDRGLSSRLLGGLGGGGVGGGGMAGPGGASGIPGLAMGRLFDEDEDILDPNNVGPNELVTSMRQQQQQQHRSMGTIPGAPLHSPSPRTTTTPGGGGGGGGTSSRRGSMSDAVPFGDLRGLLQGGRPTTPSVATAGVASAVAAAAATSTSGTASASSTVEPSPSSTGQQPPGARRNNYYPRPQSGTSRMSTVKPIEPTPPPSRLGRRGLLHKPERQPDLVTAPLEPTSTPTPAVPNGTTMGHHRNPTTYEVECATCGNHLQIPSTAVMVLCPFCDTVNPVAICRNTKLIVMVDA